MAKKDMPMEPGKYMPMPDMPKNMPAPKDMPMKPPTKRGK